MPFYLEYDNCTAGPFRTERAAQDAFDEGDMFDTSTSFIEGAALVDEAGEHITYLSRDIHPEPVRDAWEIVNATPVRGRGGAIGWRETRRSPEGSEVRFDVVRPHCTGEITVYTVIEDLDLDND